MLYGAAGHTGALIAQHARKRGHQPMLAGRNAAAVAALAERLDLPHRAVRLDDPAALSAALDGVELVLNAAGPFLRTAAPLAEACLAAGAHYIDIGNELQVFLALYDLDQRAQRAGVTIMPGAEFGVVATNCLARYVSDAVGGAQHLEVATRAAAAQQGPGIAASVRENLPYGGWTRQAGRLHPCPLGSGITAIPLPDGPCRVMPFPTGDLEAAFQATGAPDVTAYSPVPADPAALDPQAPDPEAAGPPIYRSFGWARATGPDGGHVILAQTAKPVTVHSLDAIHLGTALYSGSVLTSFVTYDKRLLEAARAAGLPVDSPVQQQAAMPQPDQPPPGTDEDPSLSSGWNAMPQ
jgi:short subunit dehydrogenase-like uncharacterized protein